MIPSDAFEFIARRGDDVAPELRTLISAAMAIEWIAFGEHRSADALMPRHWESCSDDRWDREYDDALRLDAAEASMVAAVCSGRVRCVYVRPAANDPQESPCLWTLKPALFARDGLAIDRDELTLTFFVGSSPDVIEIAGFHFFWSEIEELRPPSRLVDRRQQRLLTSPIPFAVELRLASIDGEQLAETPPSPAERPCDPSERSSRGNRRHDRSAEATFALALSRLPIDRLVKLSGKELAHMFAEHFKRAGLTPVSFDNGRKEAASIRDAVVADLRSAAENA